MKHVFVCDDTNESIMTAIFDAFSYRNKSKNDDIEILISSDGVYERDFFSEYEEVEEDIEKAKKTMKSVYEKLGREGYHEVEKAICHFDKKRGQVIFRFLEMVFKVGNSAFEMLGNEYVMKMMELSRKVWNETHLFMGFVRFSETNGILYAKIEPRCNVIPLITGHFADRFPGENWIIYDEKRKILAVHKKYSEVYMIAGDITDVLPLYSEEMKEEMKKELQIYDQYEDYWKTFVDSIAIKERYNPKLQRNLMPLWYRKNMTEAKK